MTSVGRVVENREPSRRAGGRENRAAEKENTVTSCSRSGHCRPRGRSCAEDARWTRLGRKTPRKRGERGVRPRGRSSDELPSRVSHTHTLVTVCGQQGNCTRSGGHCTTQTTSRRRVTGPGTDAVPDVTCVSTENAIGRGSQNTEGQSEGVCRGRRRRFSLQKKKERNAPKAWETR